MLVRKSKKSNDSFAFGENMPPNKKLKTGKEKEGASVKHDDYQEDFGAEWRSHCSSVSDINRYALKKNMLTDVTFNVGEESVPFQAHRLMLALRSPVFEAMFYGGLAEKGDVVTIPDVDPDGFQSFLKFIYYDEISFTSDVSAFKTYFVADKYCVPVLKDICEKYLCGYELVPYNVWLYLEGSQYLNSQNIADRCFTYLKHNAMEALQHMSFLDVTPKTIETLLCIDFLNIREMNLLLNVVRWAEHKSNAEQGNTIQSILMPLLKFIRFGALTAEEFIAFLETPNLKDLLDIQDAFDILKHINQPSTCPLPDWCCTKMSRNHVEKQAKSKQGSSSCGKIKTASKQKGIPSKRRSVINFLATPSPSVSSFVTASSPSVSSSSSSSSSLSSSSSESESDSDSSYIAL